MNSTTDFPASDDAACYRLLDHNDTIRADDEFLEDDCITWTLIGIQHRWNVGCYWHTALKPMRRISGDNDERIRPSYRGSYTLAASERGACPWDTDGDGDCHKCFSRPGGCSWENAKLSHEEGGKEQP